MPNSQSKKIRAILLDFDGTLVNTTDIYCKILKDLGNRLGGSVSRDDFLQVNGMSNGSALWRLVREKKINPLVFLLYPFLKSKYKNWMMAESKLYPSVASKLAQWKKEYKLVLVSSGRRQHLEILSNKFGILDYFETIVSRESVRFRKPNPEPYLSAATKLALDPQDCVVIEDSPMGVTSAKAAGMKCYVVLSSTPRSYFNKDSMPDHICENFEGLPDYF